MANADTANRHISALGWTALATSPPRLIYDTSDSVHCQQVSHFAGQFTGAWRSDAGSRNAMAAQHG